MKLTRLPSGPLACVYSMGAEGKRGSWGKTSGVYRAFSGSVEADGPSERAALEALDQVVRRLSVPPPPEAAAARELPRRPANDTQTADGQPHDRSADATGRFVCYREPETLPAPGSSSRGR